MFLNRRRTLISSPVLCIMLILSISSCNVSFDKISENMVLIPTGVFQMGSICDNADSDEYPVHTETVSSFRISKFEVDQTLWCDVMGKQNNPSFHKGKDLPVEMVSYHDALLFIERLNRKTGKTFRLPTEIEWEYIAYLGVKDETQERLSELSWYEDNSNDESHPIGNKKPDLLGLYDVIGNVNEWVQTKYEGRDYSGAIVNPIDTLESEYIFRGGAFNCPARYCRISNRNHTKSNVRNYAIGFRLAE